MAPMRRTALHRTLALSLVALGVSSGASVSQADHIAGSACGNARKCASHEFWPRMTLGDVQIAKVGGGATLRGRHDNDDELLGWHGSDVLFGSGGSDVLWADHDAGKQPKRQSDRLYGGAGDDFIYSSHGRNTLFGGPGNDAIKARYGRGVVDCGSGRDIVHLPKSRRRNWRFTHCEKFEYRSESAMGRGLKPLR